MAKRKLPKPRQVSSKRLASIAGRGIRAPSTLTTEEVRTLAASVLSQAADKVKEDRDPDPVPAVSPIAPLPVNQLPPPPPESFVDSLPETHWDAPQEVKPVVKSEEPKVEVNPSEPSSGSIIEQIKKIFTF